MNQNTWKVFWLICIVAFASLAVASQTAVPHPANSKTTAATQTPAAPTGEEVFNNHCGRCHMPPMTISPRITGTVIMHMRVRARLSRQDEQLLLKYMAP